MNDLIQNDLDDVFETLAQTYDEPISCPVARVLVLTHTHDTPRNQRRVLEQIAHNHAEPWAQQVAAEWLRDNQEAE